jgi:signal transduction histidine kinase
MKRDRNEESPARRLGILYVASFFTIAILSGVSQAFILRELSWQSQAISSAAHSARQRSPDHSLGVFAMGLLGASEPQARDELEGSLRNAIQLSQRDSQGASRAGAAASASSDPESASARLHRQSETHRLAATQSALSLLALFERNRSASPPSAESKRLVRDIIAEEDAFIQAQAEAAQASADLAAGRIRRMESFELTLLGLVLGVLIVEGLFVVNPAVLKIQQIMQEMVRSHDELKFYAKKLERSNKELQDFASVASHDLQEPLRKIQAFSDRLKSRCAGALDDQARDYVDRIQNAAGRMHTLINDLLTYARVASKARPFVATDLVSITREVVSDLEARIEQVNGRVEVGDLPSVEADPMQVRQLMQNLIGNSLKYYRRDVPPVVSISCDPLIEGPAKSDRALKGPYCQIKVEDNGIGFDEIYSDKIFTIFQRLHGRTEYEGTGVGLAVCRKIVERHGGSITARSTPGQGSTFLVTLPVRQPKEVMPNECES